MGFVYADIELIRTDDLALAKAGVIRDDQVRRMTVTALVDSGSYTLAINSRIRDQLGLDKIEERQAELADGNRVNVEVVGPVDIKFANRGSTVRAMVLPGDAEVLLGAIPLEDMDVQIDPRRRKLIVNPDYPYIPHGKLK